MNDQVKLFEQQKVRTHWDEKKQKWFFSIIDVIEILTGTDRSRKYWNDLKSKLKKEGSELSEKIGQLKMQAADGKSRITDVADTEQLLRLIQSIPSPKAEPFKQWLAKTGYERMKEIADPEQSLERARENWQKLGRNEKWIYPVGYKSFCQTNSIRYRLSNGVKQRMTGQETRNKLTDYWKESGVEKSDEFAFLTNIIHSEWAGLSVKKHKDLKGLKTQNLRDHIHPVRYAYETRL